MERLMGFQSTHPRWGATSPASTILSTISYFNPRTRDGVRQRPTNVIGQVALFQSTHPRWGATRLEENGQMPTSISIHAPAMGCDDNLPTLIDGAIISIHAPAMGCDRIGKKRSKQAKYFNPRTRDGVRLFTNLY